MITNCSGERSFSTLKRVKNELRNMMNQQRINHQTLMNIEHDLLQEVDINSIIYKFAQIKSRKDIPGEEIWLNEDDTSATVIDDPDNVCKKLAQNLATVFKGVQNDSFGLDNTKNGKTGSAVTKKLSQMSSFEAAKASRKIMDILLYYNKDNPDKPNNFKGNSKDDLL